MQPLVTRINLRQFGIADVLLYILKSEYPYPYPNYQQEGDKGDSTHIQSFGITT